MLVAMTSWKQCGHVVRVMSQWLTAALDEALHSRSDTEASTEPGHSHARGKGKVCGQLEHCPQQVL